MGIKVQTGLCTIDDVNGEVHTHVLNRNDVDHDKEWFNKVH